MVAEIKILTNEPNKAVISDIKIDETVKVSEEMNAHKRSGRSLRSNKRS